MKYAKTTGQSPVGVGHLTKLTQNQFLVFLQMYLGRDPLMHLFLADASIFGSIFISAAIRAVPVILFSMT